MEVILVEWVQMSVKSRFALFWHCYALWLARNLALFLNQTEVNHHLLGLSFFTLGAGYISISF